MAIVNASANSSYLRMSVWCRYCKVRLVRGLLRREDNTTKSIVNAINKIGWLNKWRKVGERRPKVWESSRNGKQHSKTMIVRLHRRQTTWITRLHRQNWICRWHRGGERDIALGGQEIWTRAQRGWGSRLFIQCFWYACAMHSVH